MTDSDPQNERASAIKPLCDLYVINKGEGFDDNLWNAYSDHVGRYDYVFSISDDDLFSGGCINPLDLLELAAAQQQDAVLFNHCEYRSPDMLASELRYVLSPSFYNNPLLTSAPAELRRYFLGYLPRHVGLLYRTTHIIEIQDKLPAFRNTLHLYAVPFMMALEKRSAIFFDYPLNYFASDLTSDGAWEDWSEVFLGLHRFLCATKHVLSPESFEVTKSGFMSNYLGDSSWLRSLLPCSMPTQAQLLAQIGQN